MGEETKRLLLGKCCRCGEDVFKDENPIVDDGSRCAVRHRSIRTFELRRDYRSGVECLRGPLPREQLIAV